jgi:hypothetical protein
MTNPTSDRDSLIAFVDRYLEALAANNASRLPLTPDARYTENAQALPFRDGLWASCDGRMPGGQYWADASTGNAAWFGGLSENGNPVILALRIKLEAQQLREAEALVVRESRVFAPDGLRQQRPIYDELLPEASRRPRDELVRTANLYFEGIERDEGEIVPVLKDCLRIENGVQTILNKDSPSEAFRMGVAEQISSGNTRHIERVRDRRFPLIDEQRGIVFCVFLFDHPARRSLGLTSGPFRSPNSMLAFETFKIKDGIIHHIEAVADRFPYGMKTGW